MKLLVIDSHVTRQSPSMRAWVDALPQFLGLFEEIEVWSDQCDQEVASMVKWRRIPLRLPTWKLKAMEFQWKVRRLLTRFNREGWLVQATGCLAIDADVHYIHFWNRALLEEAKKRPESLRLGFFNYVSTLFAAFSERDALKVKRPQREWWVVSRSLAERIKQEGADGSFHLLPNQYHSQRFHHGLRLEWRDAVRLQLGLADQEYVLIFSGFGHFERKGLRQGIQAVRMLRDAGHQVRYLVLGGSPKTLSRFRATLSPEEEGACLFLGQVEQVERYLAAADGLLFPSHFEAFSLAEIEAAAVGIRLYLTRHYGAEMILNEPGNGRWLPWDPVGMARVLEDEIQSQRLGTFHEIMGEALTQKDYQKRIFSFYQRWIDQEKNQV